MTIVETAAVRVTVVVVNWNVRDLLRICLRSLLEQGGLRPDEMRVIVVDNASRDGSAAMVRAEFPQVRLIANTDNVGFGKANNQALPEAVGEYLLLLNPDTRVEPGAIATMLRTMDRDPDIAVLGCRLVNGDGTLQRWTGGAYPRLANLANHYFFLDRVLPPSWRPMPLYLDRDVAADIEVDWISGAVMLLRADRLEGRLFDPAYFMSSPYMK